MVQMRIQGKPNRILGFTERYEFLSNYYPSPIMVEGAIFPTVEHAYQVTKTLDPDQARRIQRARTPGAAKRLGRNVDLRSDWLEIKEEVMYKLLKLKFTQHRSFREQLLDTGDAYLEETNDWNDQYWGVFMGKGRNRLGHLLMSLREELKIQINPI